MPFPYPHLSPKESGKEMGKRGSGRREKSEERVGKGKKG
jgi:hypothetical protein